MTDILSYKLNQPKSRLSQNKQERLVDKKPLYANFNHFVNHYHDEEWHKIQVDQQGVEVGEYAPVDEGNTCIVLIEENCTDGADKQGRAQDETVHNLAEDNGSWVHFVRREQYWS